MSVFLTTWHFIYYIGTYLLVELSIIIYQYIYFSCAINYRESLKKITDDVLDDVKNH